MVRGFIKKSVGKSGERMSRDMRFSTMWYVRPAKPQLGAQWLSGRVLDSWPKDQIKQTNKASDQPAHTPSLIRAFASHWNILWVLSYWLGVSKLKRRMHRLFRVYARQNATLLEITWRSSNLNVLCTCLFYTFQFPRTGPKQSSIHIYRLC